MGIENIAKAVKGYKSLYMEAQKKIDGIRTSTELTQEAKDRRVNDIEGRYEPMIESAVNDVVTVITATQEELKKDRLNRIARGLDESDKITVVVNGIGNGVYDAKMVSDMVEIYKDNPPMLEAIRGAVGRSENLEVKELLTQIPKDTTNELIKKLDKAINTIESAPKLSARVPAGDMASALWKSGQSIDSFIDFILGLQELENIA